MWEKFPIAVCGLCGRVNVNVVSVDGLGECSEGVLGVTPEVCSVRLPVLSLVARTVFGCPEVFLMSLVARTVSRLGRRGCT